MKTYLKTMKEQQNDGRREEVRANGLKRWKKQSTLKKVKDLIR